MIRTHLIQFPPSVHNQSWREGLNQYMLQCISLEELCSTAKKIRRASWELQRSLDTVLVGDFYWVAPLIRQLQWLGATPLHLKDTYTHALDQHIAMVLQQQSAPLQIDKHSFYHLEADSYLKMIEEALLKNYAVKATLYGPLTILSCFLGQDHISTTSLVAITRLYKKYLERLHSIGVQWVQIDEPILRTPLPMKIQKFFMDVYLPIGQARNRPKLLLHLQGGNPLMHQQWIFRLPVETLHVDILADGYPLSDLLHAMPEKWELSLGVAANHVSSQKSLRITEAAIETIFLTAPKRIWLSNVFVLDAAKPIDIGETASASFPMMEMEEYQHIISTLTTLSQRW